MKSKRRALDQNCVTLNCRMNTAMSIFKTVSWVLINTAVSRLFVFQRQKNQPRANRVASQAPGADKGPRLYLQVSIPCIFEFGKHDTLTSQYDAPRPNTAGKGKPRAGAPQQEAEGPGQMAWLGSSRLLSSYCLKWSLKSRYLF